VVFKQIFPKQKAAVVGEMKDRRENPVKVEYSEYVGLKGRYRDDVEEALAKLKTWKENGDYQTGEVFFALLQQTVGFVDRKLCDSTEFLKKYSAECYANITSGTSLTPREAAAQFELMVGVKQNASVSFQARSENWGVINGKLEEAFKAGIWGKGEAKAKLEQLGFSAEVQAAIAIGAQLDLEGELKWRKDRAQLSLGGSAELFVGARAEFGGKLSLSAKKGLEASIKAGAFAGFKATCKGSCAFSYDDKDLVKVEAEASVTFGVGAEFEGEIKASIFGPTKIKFGANLTVGLGTAAEVQVEINFSEGALAASQEFRKVVYWRTLAKGYKMDLMNSDARNLYYLNKAIGRLEAELSDTTEELGTLERKPSEKQSLLMAL
jgi:hypothetical protein